MREDFYHSLVSPKLFIEERKGYLNGTRETSSLLNTDQYILKENKTSRKYSHDLESQQKTQWYDTAILKSRLF